MKKDDFSKWLKEKKGMKQKTISSRLSNVTRVDNVYHIDEYYSDDRIEDLRELFEYSMKDIKAGKEPKANITIMGDYYNGMSTLRAALNLYISFLDDTGIVKIKRYNDSESKFIGTEKDFLDIIGPRCRNIVQSIAKSERKKCCGLCEYCHISAELQSAHKAGEDRITIIRNILSEYVIDDNTFEIPLREFEIKFKEKHLPIKNHFFFLCKDCHNLYDNGQLSDSEIVRNRAKKHEEC